MPLRPTTQIVSSNSTTAEAISALATSLGFDHCSWSPLIVDDIDQKSYLSWCQEGFAAGMTYMTRDPESRANPVSFFPQAKSVVTLAVSYYQGAIPPKPGKNFGRVARYAWGSDYHPIILSRLEKFLSQLPSLLDGPVSGRASIDTRPLLERALAKSSGLGFTGKNTVTIIPKWKNGIQFHVGSYIFLGEILLDVECREQPRRVAEGCGGCTNCLTACPTNAFESPYRLNAGKCISYLTIENKGWIPRSLRGSVQDWIFGCDICQDVCPFNARAFETRWPELRSEHGVGAWINLSEILTMSNENFKMRFQSTPLSRPKRRGLIRNACVAAGNSGDDSFVPLLESLTHDPEPMVRGHALGALEKLAKPRALQRAESMLSDPSEEVCLEAGSVLEQHQ